MKKILKIFTPSKTLADLKLPEPISTLFIKENVLRSEAVKELSLLGWSEEKAESFWSTINIFLGQYGLGQEWFETLTILVLTQKLCPPRSNFSIDKSFNRLYTERVVLVLNPDTSIEDLKDGWSEIQAYQKIFWPEFKKTNLNKTKFTNLLRYLTAEHGRFNFADEEKFKGLSPYQIMMAKQGRYNEVIRSRKEHGLKVKRVKPKNKKTYKELAWDFTHIKNNKKLKKEANKLSQLKKRMSQKV